MPAQERRFGTSYRFPDTDAPGLIQEDDGTVWVVQPGGGRFQIQDAAASSAVVLKSLANAKGDMIAAPAADDFDRLPVGANNKVLMADSGATLGVKWGDGTPGPTGATGAAGTGSASVIEAQLGANASAAATSITIDRSAPIPFTVGSFIVIDPFTIEAEIRYLTAVSGTTLTFTGQPLDYAHSTNDIVFSLIYGFDLIPWTWWGAIGDGTTTHATTNTTAFNRLTNQLAALSSPGGHGQSGVFVPAGTFYIDGELRVEAGQMIGGVSCDVSVIRAHSTFPFDSTGEVAMIHGYRFGVPVNYASTGPTSRWHIRDLFVSGEDVANANGILLSCQQPEAITNVRTNHCPGLYGLCLVDTQDTKIYNFQADTCGCGLRYRGVSEVRAYGICVERTTGTSSVILEGITGFAQCSQNSFYGVHCEQTADGIIIFDCRNATTAIAIYDAYVLNPHTGTFFKIDSPSANPGNGIPSYNLFNIWCSQDSATWKLIDDLNNGWTILNTSSVIRRIPYFCTIAGHYSALLGDGVHQDLPSIIGGL